ncbi:MAG: hypothetical protein AAF772_21075 [Acidobacteriota bacterium]
MTTHDTSIFSPDAAASAPPSTDPILDERALLLDAAAGRDLDDAHRADLDARLSGPDGDALARELASWRRLHGLIDADRIPVRDGFAARVMAALPVAHWQPARARTSSTWRLPIALAALLTIAAAVVALAGGSADGAMTGAGFAIGDALIAALVTGAGLLGASWQAAGMALDHLFELSTASLIAFGIGVVCLDLLLLQLLRRPASAIGRVRSADDAR